jgi:hypothetical protein
MSRIGHGYGSEWHLLRYLGYHRSELNNVLQSEMGAEGIQWLDQPFSEKRIVLGDEREYVGVEFVNEIHVLQNWAKYWPQRGQQQNWDAIGTISFPNNHDEWLLVEAKAHVGEMKTACGAKDPDSLSKINKAIADTAKACTIKGIVNDQWVKGYYQYANRLAVLNFLCNECSPAVDARLVFIGFYGELPEAMPRCDCPQSVEVWQSYIEKVHRALDINTKSLLMQRVQHIYLPINPRAGKIA